MHNLILHGRSAKRRKAAPSALNWPETSQRMWLLRNHKNFFGETLFRLSGGPYAEFVRTIVPEGAERKFRALRFCGLNSIARLTPRRLHNDHIEWSCAI